MDIIQADYNSEFLFRNFFRPFMVPQTKLYGPSNQTMLKIIIVKFANHVTNHLQV